MHTPYNDLVTKWTELVLLRAQVPLLLRKKLLFQKMLRKEASASVAIQMHLGDFGVANVVSSFETKLLSIPIRAFDAMASNF